MNRAKLIRYVSFRTRASSAARLLGRATIEQRMPLNLAPWPSPLLEARFISRHQRFLALVELGDGERVIAHCVNPGRMEGLVIPGARVWLTRSSDPKRKLRFTLELVERDGRLVGANTSVPNRFVRALLEARIFPSFASLVSLRAEVRYGTNHRVDFLVQLPDELHFLEVKNCHLVHPDTRGYFPDSVSTRASSHLETLCDQLAPGVTASVLFVVQDPLVTALRPSDTHDPTFADTSRRVAKRGVVFRAVRALPTLDGLLFDQEIPVDLQPYNVEPVKKWRDELAPFSGSLRAAPTA